MSNVSYEGVLANPVDDIAVAENITSYSPQSPLSGVLLLNSVLEGGHIPYMATADQDIALPKKVWKQIRAGLASVF
jgi:hypothetical protein